MSFISTLVKLWGPIVFLDGATRRPGTGSSGPSGDCSTTNPAAVTIYFDGQQVRLTSGGVVAGELVEIQAMPIEPEVASPGGVQTLYPSSPAMARSRYGGGLLIAETLAAGLVHGRALWFGTPANVGRHLASAAVDLGIGVHVIS